MVYVLLVFAGGGIGSVCRYGVSVLSGKLFADRFEWGTLAVNLLGCLLIGVLAGVFERGSLSAASSRALRLLLVSGFLGGFTTFSSFSYESIRLLQESPARGLANILFNLVGGLALAAVGMWIAGRV
jgi:fluoride exporter